MYGGVICIQIDGRCGSAVGESELVEVPLAGPQSDMCWHASTYSGGERGLPCNTPYSSRKGSVRQPFKATRAHVPACKMRTYRCGPGPKPTADM